ncbi:hypothetical protein SH661x_001494 [Planctomicrobium sp. SH661]|uniref:hypothetical protein n=1 Tax=Planctomicrobium sp. SH661 TaxID=3448124 RepID=UPI003F5B6A0B
MNDHSLPIPLSVFERYMVLDDRPSHPMASFLEIDLQGPMTVDQLQAALPQALNRHPLLKSIVKPDGAGGLSWVESPQPILIQATDDSGPMELPPRLDLTESPGIRIWYRKTVSGVTVICYVHHATCDALGMLTFFMEWFALAAGTSGKLPVESTKQLLRREDFSGAKAAFPLQQRLKNIARYLWGHPPVPLAIPVSPTPNEVSRSSSAYHVVRFSPDEFTSLQQSARRHGCSLNDWLAAALFSTIADWQIESHKDDSQHPWRVLIPVNRRSSEERYLSACNYIGYKMLTRSAKETGCFSQLMAGIREEMAPVRREPRGVYSFVKVLTLMHRFGLLKRTVDRYDCFATVILSNLGDVGNYFAPLFEVRESQLRAGETCIQSIRCAPPRRPNTHATIVAMTYAGEFQLISSRISPGLDDAQTLEFLERYRDEIVDSLRVES